MLHDLIVSVINRPRGIAIFLQQFSDICIKLIFHVLPICPVGIFRFAFYELLYFFRNQIRLLALTVKCPESSHLQHFFGGQFVTLDISTAHSTCPVIATDVGGQSELLDEKVGALVHYNPNADKTLLNHEINEYVEKTIEVLKDLDKRKKNSRKRILEGYTLDQMAKKFDMIFEEAIKAESKKTPREENTTMYELACNVLTEPYFKCTNAYYENYLEVYLTAPKSEHKRFLRHMRARLERLNAVKEGKDIIKFLRSLANFGKDFWECIKLFLKAFVSGIKLFLKVLLRLLTKPFRKKED